MKLHHKKSLAAGLLLALAGSTLAGDVVLNHSRLSATAEVIYNDTQIPTIKAANEIDAAFVNGYIQAKDRLFQMDYTRKIAQGKVAELLGPPAISNDVQFRTIGFERAARRSIAEASPKTQAILQAFADGVNAYVAKNGLPAEYAALEIDAFDPWKGLDSVSIGKVVAFNLSSDMEEIDWTIAINTFQQVGAQAGFDGTALFMDDLYRAAPPDDRVSIPGFLGMIGGVGKSAPQNKAFTDFSVELDNTQLSLLKNIQNGWNATDLLKSFKRDSSDKGSNFWMVSGDKTENGLPLIANDPHLSLSYPSTFYPFHMNTEDGLNVAGVGFPGAPIIAQGCNDNLCWGSTVHPVDETDFFFEEFTTNLFGLPTHTIYQGEKEPVQLIFQVYNANIIGDGVMNNKENQNVGYTSGGLTIIVPRRSNGPILSLNLETGTAISMQNTGFNATQEIESFLEMGHAKNFDEFQEALSKFDFGSQNFGVADTDGNIAYFTGSEVPIREDLQTMMAPDGVPPMFVRDGTGVHKNEWVPVSNPGRNQATPHEVIPESEMPHWINPERGYIANANNDPVGLSLDNNVLNQLRPGGGIYYLGQGAYSSYRMGRIDRLIKDKIDANKKISHADMKAFQANHQLQDAMLIMPHIMNAVSRASASDAWPGIAQFLANPKVQESVALFADWDFSTPTGITEGYDPNDNPFDLRDPDDNEVKNSVAATIYSVWRSMAVQNTIDATIDGIDAAIGAEVLGPQRPGSTLAFNAFKNLLDQFETMQGYGASGVNFFTNPAAPTPADARDYILLASLQQALDKLAGDDFAAAFRNSENVMDYRWGMLHRISFNHTLGASLSVPNGLFGFSTVDGLRGVPRSGGYQVLDASSHNVRADHADGFMFAHGPARRFVSEMAPDGPLAEQIIPGGQSGNIMDGSNYVNQLPYWLTNAYLPLIIDMNTLEAIKKDTYVFEPND
ncbi:penicillin acylase family protein [Marinicella rhabdoformis]|uniref:penicillin acylase family protein n=1 Tax=Marinicella rhabdoformis TaxID=2580566 RepID=UPI0012AED237|nr:penicillin acylase family protein [Marinicella rhabdoformis]